MGLSSFIGILAGQVPRGGSVESLPVWSGTIASTPGGATARLFGASVIAQRGYAAVEQGRSYRGRAVYWRTSDVSDPAGDAIQFGILWFDANKQPLAGSRSSTVVKNATQVRVSHGRQSVTTTLAAATGAGITIVAPPGAVYARAYVQT